MLSLLLVSSMAIGFLAGCKEKEVVPEEPVYELKPLTAEQLEAGKYYVKNGDTFYVLPTGTHNFNDKNLIVRDNRNVDQRRVIWFGPDDITIPTLYADDTLVYVTQNLPDSFVWERYKDDGYTIGLTGLTINATGSYSVVMDGNNFYPNSSMKNAVASSGASVGDSLVLDAIDKLKVSNGNVSECGSILGLQANRTYSIDMYDGSKYLPMENIVADTHIFGAYEVYTSSICNYMQANYIQVVVPDNFISGYYFINGTGFVRYVDNARSQGITDVDFNLSYYFTDSDGKVHTRDELDDDGNIIVDEEKYYSTFTNIDCSNNAMTIDISYEDAKGTNVDGSEFTYSDDEVGLPQAKLIDPDGNEDYVFVNSNSKEKTLTLKVDNPIPGLWEVRVYNAQKRYFSVATTFSSGHNDTLVHNGGNSEITYYVPENMNNALVTITWTNTTVQPNYKEGVVIKDQKINDPNDEKELTFTRDSVTVSDTENYKEGRGIVKMVIGEIKYGDYKIRLNSDYALGRVRVTFTDLDAGKIDESELTEVDEILEDSELDGEVEDADETKTN